MKKLEEYLPNIDFMTSISTDERWFLRVMIVLSKKTKEPFIDVPTFVKMSGWGEDKVKRVRRKLKASGFIAVTRVGKNGRQFFEISLQKLEDSIVKHNTEQEEKCLTNQESRRMNSVPPKIDREMNFIPPTPSRGMNFIPHNGDNIITRYNVNNGIGKSKDGCVVFYKINKFENRGVQLTEILHHLKDNKLIKGENANTEVADLLADIQYHIDDVRDKMAEVGAANAALKLLQKGTWSRPRGLREKLEKEAIAMEEAAKREKGAELKDMRANGIIDVVFGGERSSLATAANHIEKMMAMIRAG